MQHGLACLLGGLVLAWHNELCDELADLAARAFTPCAVHDEPLIHPCHAPTPVTPLGPAPSASSLPLSPPGDDRGDLLICGLWSRGTDCILDGHITDTGAKTYQSRDPLKVLASHEKNRKKNILLLVLLSDAISLLL